MNTHNKAVVDHLRLMDHRIRMQTEELERLRKAGTDASQAERTLKLLLDTRREMTVQLTLLSNPLMGGMPLR